MGASAVSGETVIGASRLKRREIIPMCAFNTALDLAKNMIELTASTLGRLAEIQLRDLATFVEHQSAAMYKAADVRDIAGLLALGRDHQDRFWKDRRNAFVATADAVQVAMELVGQAWSESMSDASAAPSGTRSVDTKNTIVAPALEYQPDVRAASPPSRPKQRNTGGGTRTSGSRATTPRPVAKTAGASAAPSTPTSGASVKPAAATSDALPVTALAARPAESGQRGSSRIASRKRKAKPRALPPEPSSS